MYAKFIPLNQQEFEKISAIVQESYKLDSNEHMVFDELRGFVEGSSLAQDLLSKKHSGTAAEYVRELLWNMFTGGGMSANVTCKAFKAIGREDECDPRWM